MSQQHNNVINLLYAGITVGALDLFQFKSEVPNEVWYLHSMTLLHGESTVKGFGISALEDHLNPLLDAYIHFWI